MNPQNRALLASVVVAATKAGLKLETHNPGDGVRIRIFPSDDPSDFHGPNRGMTTIFYGMHKNRETIRVAEAWVEGYTEAVTEMRTGKRRDQR